MKKWVVRIFALLFIAVFFYFLLACGKKKETLKLVAVTKGDILEKALAVGTIEPEKETKVKSTIPGIVQEVLFKVGDAVAAGAPLFKISPNPTPLEYVEARRSMEVAEITMSKLKADWERQVELFKGALVSESEMAATESAFREANLRYKIAGERLELLERGRIKMSNREIDSIIRSPNAGIILSSRPSSRAIPSCPDELSAGDRALLSGRHGSASSSRAPWTRSMSERSRRGWTRILIGALPRFQARRPGHPHLPQGQEGGERPRFDIEDLHRQGDGARPCGRASPPPRASASASASRSRSSPSASILFEDGSDSSRSPRARA